jgi:deazaflavin-dependent oxidoreductase (nitroreductase family)
VSPALASAAQRALEVDGTVDITTTGARSGEPRRIEIWFVHVDGRTFLTGTPGTRGWYANVLADDRLVFHLKESVTADLPARAVPVRDGETRRWLFTRPHRWVSWYREQATLEELVAGSPVVELHFEGDDA